MPIGFHSLLVVTHVAANLVWIGSILAVGLVLASGSVEPKTRGEVARQLYLKLAVPTFVISLAAGVLRLLLTPDLYFVQTRYMHGKLLFAVIVIALHHVVGARAKAMAKGSRDRPGPVGLLSALLLLSAVVATFFAVLKPF